MNQELYPDPKPLEDYTVEEKAKAFEQLHDIWYAQSDYGNMMQQIIAAQYIQMFFDGSH